MTALTRLAISTLKPGDVVQAGYKKFLTTNRFLGFFTTYTVTGQQFDSLAQLKRAVSNSDCWYALFEDCEDGDEWAAYYHNGRWCVGSSCDRLKLASAEA